MLVFGVFRFCHLLLKILQTWRHFISNLTSTPCCLSIPYSNMLLVHVTSDGYALVGDDPWEHGSSDDFWSIKRMVTFEASLILLYSKQICMDSSTCFEQNWNQKQPCNNFFLRFPLKNQHYFFYNNKEIPQKTVGIHANGLSAPQGAVAYSLADSSLIKAQHPCIPTHNHTKVV